MKITKRIAKAALKGPLFIACFVAILPWASGGVDKGNAWTILFAPLIVFSYFYLGILAALRYRYK